MEFKSDKEFADYMEKKHKITHWDDYLKESLCSVTLEMSGNYRMASIAYPHMIRLVNVARDRMISIDLF